MNEALNETAFEQGLVVRGRHWLLYGKKQLQLKQKAKLFAQSRHSEPWLFFFDAKTVPILTWSQNFVTEVRSFHEFLNSGHSKQLRTTKLCSVFRYIQLCASQCQNSDS